MNRGLQHIYHGILNVLRHYLLLPGDIVRVDADRDHPPQLVAAVELGNYVPAPFSGVFEPRFTPGRAVNEGELVAHLYDFEQVSRARFEVRAPRDGYILLQPFRAPTKKGDTMLVVAQEVAD